MEHLNDLRLPRGVGQLGTDGHVAELSVQHLFLGVRQTVLLLGGLITRENIDKDQCRDKCYQRVLISEPFAAELVSVQPGLYVVGISHFPNSLIR